MQLAESVAQGDLASPVEVTGNDEVAKLLGALSRMSQNLSGTVASVRQRSDSIAFQTNILALNPAVVAAEVRSLAQRSAEAAKEIKSLIGRSVEQVELGTVLVDQAATTMVEIVSAIRRVTHIVGEITSASVGQSSGVQQVGEAVSQMDQATQQNAALVEQSAAAAESLKGRAQQLVQLVAVFKLAHEAHAGAAWRATTATHPPRPAPKIGTEDRAPCQAGRTHRTSLPVATAWQ